MNLKVLKNSKIVTSIICFISLILVFFVYTREATISNLSLVSASVDSNGKYIAPKNITFIEQLGLLFLSSGLGYEFGVKDEVVEIGLQTILSLDLNEMSNSSDDNYIMNNEELEEYLKNEDLKNEENNQLNKEESSDTIEEIINWNEFYTKESFNTLDSNGQILNENDITVRYTTPVGLNKDNINTSSNIWQYNYRYHKDGLIGLDTSYWISSIFEDEQYFDRAYTSLKWLCQDYLDCVIVSDEKNVFQAIVYNKNSHYYWYLYLDKLYDYDALEYGIKKNTIAMTVEPISIENAYTIMNSLGLLDENGSVK